MRWIAVCLLAALSAACSKDNAPTEAAEDSARQQAVTAALDGQALVLTNAADFPVRVAVLETVYVTNSLALWCFGSDQCGTLLAANGTMRIPLGDIEGYAPGKEEVLVHWWNPADPDRQPGEGATVRTFPVRVSGS